MASPSTWTGSLDCNWNSQWCRYKGGWLFDEVLGWARQQGFVLMRVIPGFTNERTGQMLQADGVFFRS